jgi:hypothetical protein
MAGVDQDNQDNQEAYHEDKYDKMHSGVIVGLAQENLNQEHDNADPEDKNSIKQNNWLKKKKKKKKEEEVKIVFKKEDSDELNSEDHFSTKWK